MLMQEKGLVLYQVMGAARSGLGKENSPLPYKGSRISMQPGPLLSRPTPTPTRAPVQISQHYWWNGNQRKQLHTKQFLEVKKHFSWSRTFFECFFKCKSSDFLFKLKQHLGIYSGTCVLGGYRYASRISLLL